MWFLNCFRNTFLNTPEDLKISKESSSIITLYAILQQMKDDNIIKEMEALNT